MLKKVQTASGAVYLVDTAIGKIMRQGDDVKRGDGTWLTLHNVPSIEVGHIMVLQVQSLAHLGPDDYGNVNSPSPITTRVSTPVVSIEDVQIIRT